MSKETKKKKKKPVSQVRNMEITINLPREWFSEQPNSMGELLRGEVFVVEPFEEWCKTFCNNYVFQLEDPGLEQTPKKVCNPHIQASVRLKDKRRPLELVSLLYEILEKQYQTERDWFDTNKISCSPTVKFNNAMLNYKYCSKDLTRIIGPYADKTMLLKSDIPEVNRAWQKFAVEFLLGDGSEHGREILNIWDPYGGCGKTTFQKWWYYFIDEPTNLIDFSGSLGQVLAATVNAGPKSVYFINLPWKVRDKTPREKEKLGELGTAIESIKDGFLSTSYYGQGKTLCFSSPRVVIFSNTDISEYDFFAPNRLSTIIIDENASDFSLYRELGKLPKDLEESRLRTVCETIEYDPFDPYKEIEKQKEKSESGRDSVSAKDSSSSPRRRKKETGISSKVLFSIWEKLPEAERKNLIDNMD